MPVIFADNSVQAIANKALDLTAKKVGDLALATVHLFTNLFTPTPAMVVGDFTEAIFTGYVAKPLVGWNANEEPGDGSVSTDSTTVLTWVGPGDGSGQAIIGYFVLAAGGGTPLIYAAKFPAPVPLNVPTDVLALVPTYRVP